MPFVTITATQGLSADQKKQLLLRSSDAVVQSIGAPVSAVQVLFSELSADHYLSAGEFNSSIIIFVVELIEGRTEELKAKLIKALSRAGLDATGIPESNVRVRLIDYPTTNMGMSGGLSAKAIGR